MADKQMGTDDTDVLLVSSRNFSTAVIIGKISGIHNIALYFSLSTLYYTHAAVVELAYTYASGAYGRKAVRVQVPPAAPLINIHVFWSVS